jgi:hypothetical protein
VRAALGAETDYSGNGLLTSAVSDYNRLLANLTKSAAVGGACGTRRRWHSGGEQLPL